MKTLFEIIVSNFKNIVIGLLIIISAIFLYQWLTEEDRLYKELIGQKEAYQQISETLAKLEVQYKDQKDLYDAQKKMFEEIVVAKDEQIKMLTTTIFTNKNKTQKRNGSDLTRDKYVFNEVRIAGADSPPIGWVMISKDGMVRSGTYKFDIQVDNLQTIDEKTGRIKVYSKGYYIVKQDGLANRKDSDLKNWKNVKYPLNITGGVAIVDPTIAADNSRKKLFLWAPRLAMGINSGVDSSGFQIKPSVGVSLSGYGVSKNDLDFRFLEVGVGIGKTVADSDVNLKPVMWRPIKQLPNTYVGPGVTYSPKGGFGATVGISLTF